MTESLQNTFLRQATAAARAARHIFPEYAACEAALESNWGQSRLAREANNLFGQKQSATPLPGTLTVAMPTQEFIRGAWVTVPAHWICFRTQESCFRARMERLEQLRHGYSAYDRALRARNGEEFVEEVSRAWSTDPGRAAKVLGIHRQHIASLAPYISPNAIPLSGLHAMAQA